MPLYHGLRLLLGMFVLTIPALLARNALMGIPGTYDTPDDHGNRGTRDGDGLKELYSREWLVKDARLNLAREQRAEEELNASIRQVMNAIDGMSGRSR